MLGTGEMLLIAVVAIIVVDPKKLPDLMKGLGKAINEFKSMSGEFKRSMEREGEAAEFERRKAEAQEQLFGSGASKTEGAQGAQEQVAAPDSEPPQTPAQAPSPASAQAPAAEAKTQPEPQYEDVAQPPVERAAQTEASASVEAAAPVAEPAPPAPVEAAAPAPVEEAAAAPVEAAAPPAPAAEPAPPAPAEAAAPPAPVEEAAAPAPVEESAPPAASGGEAPPPPPLSGDEAVGEGHAGRMSLFDHLGDLRKRLTRSAIAVVVGFLAAYAFAGKMMKILMQPMLDALKQSHFIYTVPTEAFFAEMWVAFIAGMFLVSPYIFYQIWGFVAPGLYSHERRWIIPITLASALFFTVGALFGYFVVFPFGFEFFASYTSEILVFMPKLDDYLGFALKLLFAFGIVFELPLFLFFLAKLGIVTHVGLRAKRKYAILSAFIVAAALTPPDAISQTMMAVPLCILYEVGIWLAFFFGKKPKPQEPEAPAAA